MNKEIEEKIILYPSNWLYNAGVIGFLKVLEFGKKLNENTVFDQNTVVLHREWIKESYELLDYYHKEKLGENFSIWGKNKRYPNYIHTTQKEFFKEHFVPALSSANNNSGKCCNWCEGYFIPKEELERLKLNWIKERKENGKKREKNKNIIESFNNFLKQREVFQGIHIKELGAAFTEMPNSFWNLNFSTPLCHLCSYLIIFHHLAFQKIEKNYQIFINTPHFRLTWDLNKFAEKILAIQKKYEIPKVLGNSLLQWTIKMKPLLGAWTMMNIEMIIKKRATIDYFDFPFHITKILLDYEIADLINRIREEKIFDLILNGKFSEIEKVNYFVLRTLIRLKNNESISKNDPVTNYLDEYKNKNQLLNISKLLPELYAKLTTILTKEIDMNEKFINIMVWKLKETGKIIPKEVAESIDKLGFRLLEQIRLGNKDNVFYMLLRCFAGNNKKLPEELVEIFKPEYDDHFKILIYAFLAPIFGEELKQTKGGEEE